MGGQSTWEMLDQWDESDEENEVSGQPVKTATPPHKPVIKVKELKKNSKKLSIYQEEGLCD